MEEEAPLHISNVMPWSDKDGKGVRVKIRGRRQGQEGPRLRQHPARRSLAGCPGSWRTEDDAKSKKKKLTTPTLRRASTDRPEIGHD